MTEVSRRITIPAALFAAFTKIARGTLSSFPELQDSRTMESTPRLSGRRVISRGSTSYPVKFPTDTVEDLQLPNAKLEDITSTNTLTNYLILIGGSSLGICNRNILGALTTNELVGASNKASLASTLLAQLIISR
ncbi:hypothetical protein EG68_10962 [Paragonimus skrjabini miyazakii]|uniref:Uncharacterized protein n=1 Tax=Paragonimus skrjabini miyazakii TaxID=59628 RepID=A0A8S9YGH0_9TREM|nr:hypothetical protein EG68_10962 [Paragonimus skrjabini miyazakii]